jgi:hypothetical protein
LTQLAFLEGALNRVLVDHVAQSGAFRDKRILKPPPFAGGMSG